MITADETIPAPFDELDPRGNVPYALALLLCGEPCEGALRLELGMDFGTGSPPPGPPAPSALRFLRWFLGDRLQPLVLGQAEYILCLK